MYTRFFGLSQVPFSIAPDPRYLFMSERHREALAHLLYGLKGGGGFVLLTGEIGAGKTTVCRLFLEQIPAHCNVAYIFNPKQTVIELLQSICDEFHVTTPRTDGTAPTVKDFIDPLNSYLLRTHAADQNNVLIIDEAQNLSADVLEQLRLLTNLETNERKLLQIILIGQPELRSMLARPELEQLAQRVIARFHLSALTADETAQYIGHRLAVAGHAGASPFSTSAMRRIHQRARGIPRRINLLCDRALLGAYAGGKAQVDARTIDRAAREVFDSDPGRGALRPGHWRPAMGGLAAGAVVVALIGGAALSGARWPIGSHAAGSGAATALSAAEFARAVALDKAAGDARPKALDAAPKRGVDAVSPATAPTALAAASAASLPPVDKLMVTAPAEGSAVGSKARDLDAAYRSLASLWGVSLAEGVPCRVAQQKSLYCFSSSKGLAEIREIDRPGILTLRDDQDRPYYALLLGLAGNRAVLRIDGTTETVSRDALARRWRGDFATFWRGPKGYAKDLSKGDRGAVVDWVATQLAVVEGTGTPTPDRAYNDALIARVRQFQLARGLRPDGMAGPQTLMRLATVAGLSEPRLQTDAVPLDSTSRK